MSITVGKKAKSQPLKRGDSLPAIHGKVVKSSTDDLTVTSTTAGRAHATQLKQLWALCAPRTGEVDFCRVDELGPALDQLAQMGARVSTLGLSQEGRPLMGLRLGSGPRHISVMAGNHADEPTGTATLLHLSRRLLTEPQLTSLLEQYTFHFVPMANPDGTARNEPWFERWRTDQSLPDYFRFVRRDAPSADVEFGFPNLPAGACRAENQALARWLDSIGNIEHHVSLHSMFLGGGGLMLVMNSESDRLLAAERVRFVLDRLGDLQLPLHDKDRFGQKGFNRLGPGVHTAPTGAAMQGFFQNGGASATAQAFKVTSMEYAQANCQCPVAIVTEIPLCFDHRLSSMEPVEHTRAEEERRLSASLQSEAGSAMNWVEQLTASAGPAAQQHPETRRVRERIQGAAKAAEVALGDLDRYGNAPATEGNVWETRLQTVRRRIELLSQAELVGKAVGADASLLNQLGQEIHAAYDTLTKEFDLKFPSLELQVQAQIAAIFAGLAANKKED